MVKPFLSKFSSRIQGNLLNQQPEPLTANLIPDEIQSAQNFGPIFFERKNTLQPSGDLNEEARKHQLMLVKSIAGQFHLRKDGRESDWERVLHDFLEKNMGLTHMGFVYVCMVEYGVLHIIKSFFCARSLVHTKKT